jgi:ATP-dependent exoDNAse (exonuclease V) beta subunit
VSVTGRIDAIFEREDGVWEIVDYKTGSSEPDPLQLAIYERAVEQIWGKQAESRWLLLRGGIEENPAITPGVHDVIRRIASALPERS